MGRRITLAVLSHQRHFVLMLSLLVFSAGNGLSQSSIFVYQGRLSDGGVPANGSHDLQFRLRDAPVGGIQIGATVVREDVSVTNGLFSVSIDFGPTSFPGADRWLEIGVRPGASTGEYETLSPLQPIASTPYSIQSLNASNLGGVAASQYVLTSDPRLSAATDVNCANPCLSSPEIVDGTIVNADISASAAIAPTKIAGTAATLGANTYSGTQSVTTGNLTLPVTTNGNNGVLTLGGERFLHRFGSSVNTFVGGGAGNFAMIGNYNTGIGALSLSVNTNGSSNTGVGGYALR